MSGMDLNTSKTSLFAIRAALPNRLINCQISPDVNSLGLLKKSLISPVSGMALGATGF